MNKTPEAQQPVVRSNPLLFWRQKKKQTNGFVPMVAEPLTEEEASAELAARQAAMEEAERARHEKQQAKLARKAARKAERDAARRIAEELAIAKRGNSDADPIFRVTMGRIALNLSTAASIVVGASICIGLVGAYAAGVRVGASGRTDPVKVAALNSKAADGPAGDERSSLAALNGNDRRVRISPPAKAGAPEVQANAPMEIETSPPAPADDPANYNYLEIQWFGVTRDKSSKQLLAELEDVRRFLREKGIETFARKHPSGYLLFSADAFPTAPEFRKEKEDFRRRIAGFGREYRQQGGLYDWKDCYFVSYNRAVSGQPI